MFFIFFICVCFFITQMPLMTNCLPMPIANYNWIPIISLYNSTYQFPCFPPIDFKTQKVPPHVDDQEFKDCMQAKIDKISWFDNQSRTIFQRMEKYMNNTIKPSAGEEEEFKNQLFDILDKNKVKRISFIFYFNFDRMAI